MAAPNKVVISLDPESKALLKSIDRSLQQIAKNGKPIHFLVSEPTPVSDPSQEAGQ